VETSPGEMSRIVSMEVRAWMARRSLTQADLAAGLGITRQAVSLRLSGKTAWTVDDVAVVARVLNVPVTTLLHPPSPE
jgi:transcriptional regulator with XRE-family HTH domain